MVRSGLRLLIVLTFTAPALFAQSEMQRHEWKVDGVVREGLVCAPANAKKEDAPVVFVFHGHGGTMRQASRSFSMHAAWPEAICVYLQGLNTPGQLTDPDGKRPGWQKTPGDQGDRDLKLFDQVLTWLHTEYKVDGHRVYATGHSNGGGFTYLLWAKRGEVFAAVAPSAAAANRRLGELKPLPAMHIAGRNDPLVKFAWQEATIEAIKKNNGVGAGKPWGEHCTMYASEKGAPLVTYITDGDHGFERGAVKAMVKFFKEQAK